MARKPTAAPDLDPDQAPAAGGSYLREADGTLTKKAGTRHHGDDAADEAIADIAVDVPAADVPAADVPAVAPFTFQE